MNEQQAQFTPGPWAYKHRKTAESMYNTEVFCAKGATIATFAWYPMPTTPKGVTGTYREGNARLCAAAPEMLDALRQAVVTLAGVLVHAPELGVRKDYEIVSAAIAKATRSNP